MCLTIDQQRHYQSGVHDLFGGHLLRDHRIGRTHRSLLRRVLLQAEGLDGDSDLGRHHGVIGGCTWSMLSLLLLGLSLLLFCRCIRQPMDHLGPLAMFRV